jgi:hypothetical protein
MLDDGKLPSSTADNKSITAISDDPEAGNTFHNNLILPLCPVHHPGETSGRQDKDVLPRPTPAAIRPFTSRQLIPSRFPKQLVIALLAKQGIISASSEHLVATATGQDPFIG